MTLHTSLPVHHKDVSKLIKVSKSALKLNTFLGPQLVKPLRYFIILNWRLKRNCLRLKLCKNYLKILLYISEIRIETIKYFHSVSIREFALFEWYITINFLSIVFHYNLDWNIGCLHLWIDSYFKCYSKSVTWATSSQPFNEYTKPSLKSVTNLQTFEISIVILTLLRLIFL